MGKLGKILEFLRVERRGVPLADVTADTGAGFIVTAEGVGPAGDDAQPLAGDYAALMPGPGTGREIAVGYLDPVNPPVAGPGEKRIYARDDTGAPVVAVWLQADGSVLISNSAGSVLLQPDGTINMNGVTIDVSGSLSAPSIVANGLELAGHTHPVTTAPGTTGPNT